MREEKANWRDDEMNRIIMEMRERFQSEMSTSNFWTALAKKNGLEMDSQEMLALQKSMEHSFLASNPQSEDKMAHSFLPRLHFRADDANIWNTVMELDADESFAHICVGDKLLSINGRAIDDCRPIPENCKVHDYTVTWSNGPLGVTLKDDCATQKIPIVNRLTKKAGSVAVKQNIAIGDVLVAINNIDTIQLGCSLSMSILKKVQLPAKLRFRGVGGSAPGAPSNNNSAPEVPPRSSVTVSRAPSLKPENISIDERAPSVMNFSMSMSRPSKYTVNWGEGPLGLTIIPGLNEGDLPVIKKVTGTGTSVGIDKAQVGDFLESMNGIETSTMHFEDVVSYLKTAPKPVLLRFRAALDEDEARARLHIVVMNSNNLSRSVVSSGSDRGLGAGVTPGNADKFSSIQAPFLVQNKLSTGRRQKMLKGLKK
ncbi:putative PDZ-domain-containing protein [Phytophthora cinnamomi]|uniref:putative PDZ-domain-containing protein n=1 Tax=Phytophthora cinnamomi TaxID=4785 RepID=UPI00355A9E2F|nr:putative PDZ-domain-containing protein [Phytophthora cinnamomi]